VPHRHAHRVPHRVAHTPKKPEISCRREPDPRSRELGDVCQSTGSGGSGWGQEGEPTAADAMGRSVTDVLTEATAGGALPGALSRGRSPGGALPRDSCGLRDAGDHAVGSRRSMAYRRSAAERAVRRSGPSSRWSTLDRLIAPCKSKARSLGRRATDTGRQRTSCRRDPERQMGPRRSIAAGPGPRRSSRPDSRARFRDFRRFVSPRCLRQGSCSAASQVLRPHA